MLEKVKQSSEVNYIDFSSIRPDSYGEGICYVYNGVIKRTKAGNPFVTLYLRDSLGNAIPGYVFDIKSNLMAGGELAKVINQVVLIRWSENYLPNIGLTVILEKVGMVTDPSPRMLETFCGGIPNVDSKRREIEDQLFEALALKVTIPHNITVYSSVDYSQGRVGGLCQHYWKMSHVLSAYTSSGEYTSEEIRRLYATFALYILVHSTYVKAHSVGKDDIDLVSSLTSTVHALSEKLCVGTAALELVNMFFGYKPRDIYVRTIVNISENVKRAEREIALYRTIPLQQEGDAGYGAIRRYVVEKGN